MADDESPVEELPPAPEEGGGGGDNSAPAKAKSAKGGSPWVPILVMVVLFPVLIFVMVDFVIIPRMKKALNPAGTTAQHGEAHEEAEEEHADEGHGEALTFQFDDIVANLSGSMQTRYIKTTFTVEGTDPKFVELMEKNRPKLVDAALRVLSNLTIKDLDQPGIQNTVRSDLLSVFESVLKKKVVKEIYFSEFVAQ